MAVPEACHERGKPTLDARAPPESGSIIYKTTIITVGYDTVVNDQYNAIGHSDG